MNFSQSSVKKYPFRDTLFTTIIVTGRDKKKTHLCKSYRRKISPPPPNKYGFTPAKRVEVGYKRGNRAFSTDSPYNWPTHFQIYRWIYYANKNGSAKCPWIFPDAAFRHAAAGFIYLAMAWLSPSMQLFDPTRRCIWESFPFQTVFAGHCWYLWTPYMNWSAEHFHCFLVEVNCVNRVAKREAFRCSSRYTWHRTTKEKVRQGGIKPGKIRDNLPRVISGHLGSRLILQVTSL